MALIKKLRKKKKEAPANEKPDVVKTHLRNMVIVPEMTGSIVGVYNGKVFTQVGFLVQFDITGFMNAPFQVEVKPEMIGHYLGEFSISYKVRTQHHRIKQTILHLYHGTHPVLFPAPEIREFSRILSFSGNGTENSVLFQNWSKTPQKASK